MKFKIKVLNIGLVLAALVFGIFLGADAVAYPAINDSVTYEGTMTFTDKKVTLGFIQELSLISFDKVKSEFTMKTILYTPDGQAKVDQQPVALTDIKSKADIQLLLASCDSSGGKREVIEVSGGTFDTCHLQDTKGNHIWLGDVPFNIVKQISVDDASNSVMQLEVSLYTLGQDL